MCGHPSTQQGLSSVNTAEIKIVQSRIKRAIELGIEPAPFVPIDRNVPHQRTKNSWAHSKQSCLIIRAMERRWEHALFSRPNAIPANLSYRSVLSTTGSDRRSTGTRSASQGSPVQMKLDRYAPRAASGKHARSMYDYFFSKSLKRYWSMCG